MKKIMCSMMFIFLVISMNLGRARTLYSDQEKPYATRSTAKHDWRRKKITTAHHTIHSNKTKQTYQRGVSHQIKKGKNVKEIKKKKYVRPHKKRKLKPEIKPKEEDSQSPLTGTFTMATNYMFRGVSQTNNTPAFQGGLTYTFKKIGLYLDLWGSNVYWPLPDSDKTATIEIDPAIGIKRTVNKNISYDIQLVRYVYPKASSLEYNELIASLTYRFLTGLIGYSNNVFNSHGSGTYYNLAVSFDVPARYVYFNDVTFDGGIGYYSLPKSAGNSYADYALGLNKKIKNYTLTVQFTDTNHRFTNNALDSAHLIGLVTANF